MLPGTSLEQPALSRPRMQVANVDAASENRLAWLRHTCIQDIELHEPSCAREPCRSTSDNAASRVDDLQQARGSRRQFRLSPRPPRSRTEQGSSDRILGTVHRDGGHETREQENSLEATQPVVAAIIAQSVVGWAMAHVRREPPLDPLVDTLEGRRPFPSDAHRSRRWRHCVPSPWSSPSASLGGAESSSSTRPSSSWLSAWTVSVSMVQLKHAGQSREHT